ncbi:MULTISPECIES: BspA family leucine-rich repeat surface protein [Segatella]|jgi:surface protein|uniref:BspA family leucine-rich repeat surface protein n=1 Tax=Segatella TaxID=2974251 RepID=UPI00185F4606|nr:BspA family leucine-rich repeat surface protein [Segatella copri]MBM0154656.1 BspA family leucine-rich repeat surface protein [Segatella copri]QNT65486.1 BspA family leucine-rich repeat surface protein [Segatella copri]
MNNKKSTISKQWSYITDLVSTNAVKSRRLSLLMLMLLTLLFVPTRVVAQIDYDTSVKFKALAGNPEGIVGMTYTNLFDGQKTRGNFSMWCCGFINGSSSAYVIFEASKAGVPVGYTITTGDDNASMKGRNPLSWKLYGNNEGKDGNWKLIQEISNDEKLEDKNYASYDFKCEGSTYYKYFKWEITAIHSGKTLQVGEFELKLKTTCSHKNADGSSALGKAIETIEATCVEHGYTTHECSICHSIVKVDNNDELKKHTPTHHVQIDATCTATGKIEYWQCSVCKKLFSDANATTEITDAASLDIPAKGHKYNSEGTCTVCGVVNHRCALFDNLDGITNVTITDNDARYPWQMLNLEADGMKNLGFDIPKGSKGLMSDNYDQESTTSRTVVTFTVEKLILLTFKYLVSSEEDDKATITLDSKTYGTISGIKEIEIKALLSAGKHSLNLSYEKDRMYKKGADRAFIYNLKTATTISDYVAQYDDTNTTLTFKKVTDANISDIVNNSVIVDQYNNVKEICTTLGNVTIKNIVFDESFKTYAPTSLKDFFKNCTALETISNIENLNTANVTNMTSMFDNCQNLSSLNLSKFNTENVTNMSYMFDNCQNLSSLDLSKFNTAKVTNMYAMFTHCQNLSSLDLSKFNTANVTDMSWMFSDCQLSSLDLSNFNTEKVREMYNMFSFCQKLSSLNLTNFNTEKVTNMDYMFNGCSDLTTIYASDKFIIAEFNNGYKMFYGCKLLKGALPKYDENLTSSDYANYVNGYFTKLVGKNGEEKIGAVGDILTADNLTLDDNKDFVVYEPFTAKAASYSREMKTGTTWATLCLPFEVSLENKDFRAFKLLSANEGTNTVELEEITTSIAAGTPVIIKMNEGATELNFSVDNKEIAKEVNTSETENGSYQLQGIYTKKVFDKDADNNCYIVKGDKLMNPAKLLENTNNKTVGSKPFRAYMVDNSTATAAGAKMFSIAIGGGTTAIDSLNTIADDNATYYDLQGNRLNAPQKGINIVKRGSKTMKVIIK